MSLDPSLIETLDLLEAKVSSAKFRKDVDAFLDKYVGEYENLGLDAENKLSFTRHHEEFQVWAEKELEEAVAAERIAVLCEALPSVLGGGVASKEYIDSLGKHERTINILIAFTDFQQFRIMMNTRALGSKKKKTSAIVGLEHHEAGHTQIKDMLQVAKTLEAACSAADGKKLETVFDEADLKVFRGEHEQKRVMSVVVSLDMTWQEAVDCFVDMTSEREKWDDAVGDMKLIQKKGENDEVVTFKMKKLPSLLRWMLGVPETVAFRVVKEPLAKGEGLSYVTCSWDIAKDCLSKKPDVKKSGVIKPHPDFPDSKCILTAVEQSSMYIPDWILMPLLTSQIRSHFPAVIARFRKVKRQAG